MNLIKINNINYISAKDVYVLLGIKRQFSQWVTYNINRALLKENEDFLTKMLESTGGRKTKDYLLKINAGQIEKIRGNYQKQLI